jgi:hypothetical protein
MMKRKIYFKNYNNNKIILLTIPVEMKKLIYKILKMNMS